MMWRGHDARRPDTRERIWPTPACPPRQSVIMNAADSPHPNQVEGGGRRGGKPPSVAGPSRCAVSARGPDQRWCRGCHRALDRSYAGFSTRSSEGRHSSWSPASMSRVSYVVAIMIDGGPLR